ncbi:uncharacterized protein [Anas acuta]|uniref:uncharacterized protein isoform X2 n=1 Tax=Anas acuta TaxID=28680 RepID=UPI0035C89B8B
MLGQVPWARLSPSGPAVLLLALCGSMTSQDMCSFPGTRESFPPRARALGSPTTVSSALWQPFTAVSPPGDLLAPALQMNSTSAQPGTTDVLQCILHVVSRVRQVIFCKDGMEVYSLKAQQGQLRYSVVLNITSRSAGRYTCGYQERNEMKYMRSSALSAGRILNVPGNVASTPERPSSPGSSPSHKAQLPSRGETLLISPSQHSCPPRLALATLCSSSLPGSAMPLEVWILRSALSLLLLLSAPIITLLLERCSHSANEARQPGDVPVAMVL